MRFPIVTIITATYNRCDALFYTIQSVLDSHFNDWEHIIVGDGCTDATQEMIASIGDPRITFANLEENSGDEATPHNEGFRRAQGRYIAYLHHDDLWLPNHLNTVLESITSTDSDFVSTLALGPSASGPTLLHGVFQDNKYCPFFHPP